MLGPLACCASFVAVLQLAPLGAPAARAESLVPRAASKSMARAEERVRRVLGYELHVDGSLDEVEELARLVEQAHAGFAALFKAAPSVKEGELVRVHLVADREEWRERIRRDGRELPDGIEYVYFDPESNAVYLFRQDNPYRTRAFLIHGLCQQFHCKCKAKNRDLVRTWLAMGVADHMSLHTWDGAVLTLGARPIAGTHDPLAVARATLDPERFDPSRLYEEGILDPAVCFAIVRYLSGYASVSQQKRFYKLALGYTGSKLDPRTYAKSLGDPAKLTRELLDFLDTHQQPMQTLSGEWEDRGGNLRARSRGEAGIAVLRAPATRLAVVVRPDPRGAAGGVVFGAPGTDDSIRVEVFPDEILVRGRNASGDDVLDPHPNPAAGGAGVEVALACEGRFVTVAVAGEQVGRFELAADPRLGLFVEGGTIDFDAPRWE